MVACHCGLGTLHCGAVGHRMGCPLSSPDLRRMSRVTLQPGQRVHEQTGLLSGQWRLSKRPVRQIGQGVLVDRLICLTWLSRAATRAAGDG